MKCFRTAVFRAAACSPAVFLPALLGGLHIASGVAPPALDAQVGRPLPPIVQQVARNWNAGQRDSVLLVVADAGVRVTLLEADLGLLDRRQVNAALANFFETRRGQGIEIRDSRVVEGTPASAFAELAWTAIQADMPELQAYTIYLGFRRSEAGEWRISDMRVIR